MKELYELQQELSKLESELASITKTTTKNTPFHPGELDGYSENYSYKEYSNPSRARYLETKIADLKNQIQHYSIDAAIYRQNQEKTRKENQKLREEKISSTAKEIYDEKVNEYMNKNFWGKARAIISGKKPKKMNEQEMIQKYATDAASRIKDPIVDELNRQRQEQLARAQQDFANDPSMLQHAITVLNETFDEKIEAIQNKYDKAEHHVIEGRKR